MDEVKLGEMRSPYGTATVMRGHYGFPTGPLAVWLDGEDGERLAILSVNLQDDNLEKDHFWVPTWKYHTMVEAARQSGLFQDTGRRRRIGSFNMMAELWRIVS